MGDKVFRWLKKKHLAFLQISLTLLFVDVMVDPTNLLFHLKYILFLWVLILELPRLRQSPMHFPRLVWFVIFFISFFMPFYELSVGFLNNILHNEPLNKIAYFTSFFFFIIILVTLNEKINLTVIFNFASLSIVIITLGLYLILIFDIHLFGDLYRYLVLDKKVVVYALRNYGNITLLMIFYKTSPLLVFPLSWYLHKLLIDSEQKLRLTHFFFLIFTGLTLYFSGTRANLVSLVFITIFYLGYFLFKKNRIGFVWALGLGLLVVVFVLPLAIHLLLNPHEASNMIKFGYLPSYENYFNRNWQSLLFGQGGGSVFYAGQLDRFVGVTELTYLELIRIWGIPVTLLFIAVLIMPLVAEIKSGKISHLFIAYLSYLFISGTNPLLLSSTGMLVLVYVFTLHFRRYHLVVKQKTSITGETFTSFQ